MAEIDDPQTTTPFVREPLPMFASSEPDPNAIVVAQYSVPFVREARDIVPFVQVMRASDEANVTVSRTRAHPMFVAAVMVGAFAIGIGIALFAI